MQSLVSAPDDTARRLHRLVEPIHLVTYFSDEPVQTAGGVVRRGNQGLHPDHLL